MPWYLMSCGDVIGWQLHLGGRRLAPRTWPFTSRGLNNLSLVWWRYQPCDQKIYLCGGKQFCRPAGIHERRAIVRLRSPLRFVDGITVSGRHWSDWCHYRRYLILHIWSNKTDSRVRLSVPKQGQWVLVQLLRSCVGQPINKGSLKPSFSPVSLAFLLNLSIRIG